MNRQSILGGGRRAGRLTYFAGILFLLAMATAFAEEAHIVFTSDQHYGVTRETFRGRRDADAGTVNAAMVEAINSLADARFPDDCGAMAGKPVAGAELFISGGDIANRMEGTDPGVIPTAAACWDLYERQYLNGLSLRNRIGEPADMVTIPGNHDLSNAIGFHKTMTPPIDKTAMLKLYERATGTRVDPAAFDPRRHTVFLSRDVAGIRLYFIQMWPDSVMRDRLAQEIAALPHGTPVILFTHIQPDIDAKRFTNPNGDGGINATDKFENLVPDISSAPSIQGVPLAERRELARFIREHLSIVAYFHGHEHENTFYLWRGPDGDVALPTFMVDSPMKGKKSAADERLVSFHSIAIDSETRLVTVRQVLWNVQPDRPALTWGDCMTFPYPASR